MNSPKTFNVVLSAVATTWFFRLLNAVSSIITLPIILISLGKNEYGLWVLIGQVIRFLTISDMGIANAISRFIARFRGENNLSSIETTISTVLTLTTILGLLVALLTLIISPFIPSLLAIGPEYKEKAKIVFLISGLSLALIFPTRVGMGILAGYQLYGPHGIGKILKSLLFLIFIVLLAWLKKLDVINLAFASGLSIVLGQAVLLYFAWKMTGPWNISFKKCSRKLAKEMISFGTSALLVTLSKLLYNQGLGIALGRIAGLSAVAVYGISYTIVMYLEPIIGAIGGATPTLASEFHARGESAKLKKNVNQTILATFSLILSAMFGIFIYIEPIMKFILRNGNWTSDDFISINRAILIMLTGVVFWLPQVVSRSTLQVIGKHWIVTYAVVGSSIVSFCVGVIGMSLGLGVYAAAIAFCFEMFFEGIVIFPRMLCKFLDQSISEMISKAYLPGFIVGLSVLMTAYLLSKGLGSDSIIKLCIGILTSSIIGILVLIPVCGQTQNVLKLLKKNCSSNICKVKP